jgi:hypothetical protein
MSAVDATATPAPPANKGGNFLGRFSLMFDNTLQVVFERVGLFVAARPWQVIIATFTLAGLLTLGILTQKTQFNGEKLFTPQTSRAVSDREFIEATFPSGAGVSVYTVFATARGDGSATGDNLLHPSTVKQHILDMIQLRESLLTLDAPCASVRVCMCVCVCVRVCHVAMHALTAQATCRSGRCMLP